MLFTDHLHGTIDFTSTQYADLIYDLLGCPEVQRLRHMRLMNFDVPYIQDLASTKRFPHSIGTCFLAYKTTEKSSLPIADRKKIIAAALIHDIGILPFGHLLESIIKSQTQDFSHENLVLSILKGTYHPTNVYHQIIGAETLKLHKVLRKHHLNPDEIFSLICPSAGNSSAISADVDLDNLDNIHRMATLLGFDQAKDNLKKISEDISISKELKLVFTKNSKTYVEEWLKMRQSIYTMIIGHPSCVSYNAFLSQLLTQAVDSKIVTKDEWFITDQEFENRLMAHSETDKLARYLFVRPHFELIDYVWAVSNDKPNIKLQEVQRLIQERKVGINKNTLYFFWSENKLISREIIINTRNGTEKLGINSHSILISLISKHGLGSKRNKDIELEKQTWRKSILDYLKEILPTWNYDVKFPQDFNPHIFNTEITNGQLDLFN